MQENSEYQMLSQALLDIIYLFHQRAWSPATSTNYSFLNPTLSQVETYTITSSGKDKGQLKASDLMIIDTSGRAVKGYEHLKPSAETHIHLMLYKTLQPQVILHTHSVEATAFSLLHQSKASVEISGLELLKGLQGISSHEASIQIPIFENSQDIPELSKQIEKYIQNHSPIWGFLLAGHGLYTWGNSMQEAKRHVEVFEFVFECLNKLYSLGKTNTNLNTSLSKTIES